MTIVKMIEAIDKQIREASLNGFDVYDDFGRPDFGKISQNISLIDWVIPFRHRTQQDVELFNKAYDAYQFEIAFIDPNVDDPRYV